MGRPRATTAVAGAAGYIGGRLVAQLRDAGHDVVPLVQIPRPWLGDEQVVVDLGEDDDHLVDALTGATAVIHLAGLSEVVAAHDPDLALANTIIATRRLADACVKAGVPRIVYVSTVHVYGARLQPGDTVTEDLRCEPRQVYAVARLASEHVLASIAPDLDIVVVRLTNSIGAPLEPSVDRWTLVGNDLCRQATTEGRLVLRSSGMQHRDFIDLGDVCATLTAAADPAGVIPAGLYNLGSGRALTIRAVAGIVQDVVESIVGTRPELDAPPADGPAPIPYIVDVSRLAKLGFAGTTPIETSIEQTVQFCLTHLEELAGV